MKTKQVLSIEQMKHLYELGLDTSEASMHWQFLPTANAIINGTDELEEEPCLFISQPNMKHEYPAYTLQDIIGRLPCYIRENSSMYKMSIEPTLIGTWVVSYGIGASEPLLSEESENLIDAAYEMLCWLIENEYVKNVEN